MPGGRLSGMSHLVSWRPGWCPALPEAVPGGGRRRHRRPESWSDTARGRRRHHSSSLKGTTTYNNILVIAIVAKYSQVAICHCEVIRGQWPQVTLASLDNLRKQCQVSHLVIALVYLILMKYPHSSQSYHSKLRYPTISLKSGRKLFHLWRHSSVAWLDPQTKSSKVVENISHKLCKISALYA